MRNRGKGSRRFVTAAFAAFALAGATYMSVAFAQPTETGKQAGTIVSIIGSGDDVRAFGARVSVDGASARVKAAGAVVDVRGAVEGPIWAAGADVTVAAQTGGSVWAAGAHIVVRGRTAGDVTARGAVVDIDAATDGRLRVAGANVRVGALSDIGGSLSAAGANVVFDGHVTGDAEFSGAVVTFNGRADGSVTVYAETLIVGPLASITGDLFVQSLSKPTISPDVVGGTTILTGPGPWFDDLPEKSIGMVAAAVAAAAFLAGLLFLMFARNTFGEAVDHVRFRPISSVVYGAVSILVLMLLAALLMSTVVGLGLGVALLLLLPVILVLGHTVAVTGIMGWILRRRAPRLGVIGLLFFLIIGAAVFGLVWIIPLTGPWIVLVATIFGAGGLLRAVLWRFRSVRDSGPRDGAIAAGGRREPGVDPKMGDSAEEGRDGPEVEAVQSIRDLQERREAELTEAILKSQDPQAPKEGN